MKIANTVSGLLLTLLVTDSYALDREQVLLLADQPGDVSLAAREHWMGIAKQALHDLVSPCPREAFGAAIVNHTSTDGLGELVCIGANGIIATGNPTLHGEIAGINNCTAVLQDPSGPYKLSPSEVSAAFRDLTLYTTAEPCPMCASAIRWAGFKECVFATSVETLAVEGWNPINMTSRELFGRTNAFATTTELFGGVLDSETDPMFQWQFNPGASCPAGCERKEGACSPL